MSSPRTKQITTSSGRTIEIGIPGRSKYKPTKTDVERVKRLVLLGIPEEMIAKCIGADGVDVGTLHRHFHDILVKHRNETLGKISYGAYRLALLEEDGGLKGVPITTRAEMMKFVLKTRAGWKENDTTVINANNVQIVKRVIGIDESDI